MRGKPYKRKPAHRRLTLKKGLRKKLEPKFSEQGPNVAESDALAAVLDVAEDIQNSQEEEVTQTGHDVTSTDTSARTPTITADSGISLASASSTDAVHVSPTNSVLETPKTTADSRCSNVTASSRAVHLQFHDYALPSPQIEVSVEGETGMEESTSPAEELSALLCEAEKKIAFFLPHLWTSMLFDDDGAVDISVHRQKISADSFVENLPLVSLQPHLIDHFVDRAVAIINRVRAMEVCAGADQDKYASVWGDTSGGFIDRNLFGEARYVETFRSTSCSYLVNYKVWRCEKCRRLFEPLKRQLLRSEKENMHVKTSNIYLTEQQKLNKMKKQSEDLKAANKKIKALHAKIAELVQKDGVIVDEGLNADLTEILKSSCTVSPAQDIFLQQQIKASLKNKKKCGMRWHPTMIRLALAVHVTSPAAYDLIRDTGMIKLPSSRTLYDYSHVKPVEEGIDRTVLESIGNRMKGIEDYKKYHVLLADEMYISKNLVFQKSSGKMVGYTKLDELDREVRAFNSFLDEPDNFQGPAEQVSSKVLCYMVKSTAYNVKEVVACYAVQKVTPQQMYAWTWHVIAALERNDIRVIAFVCDGDTTNRAFIKLHTPKTKVKSGIVFDTVNKAAPERDLYFFSDVPHLLKTTRNCFYSSRAGKGKGKRCMTKGGKKIVWDYIIRLYKEDKHCSVRKAYKLNPANVFPDAFSCMKVSYAAQILSDSVASALEAKQYRGVEETVTFIREVNAWFDRLNGAHSSVGQKKRNTNLNSYKSVDDPRFEQLLNFLKYLDDWRNEAYQKNHEVSINSTADITICNESALSDDLETFDPFEDIVEDSANPSEKRVLSHQTQLGIEMTTLAFIGCTKFLLAEGTHFINARVFSQDPLEQFFSKQRAGGGGSTNPNLSRFLNRGRLIHMLGQLGIKCRKGNSSEGDSH
ncbi:hypothetical protein FOCC_FOCC012454, partial [Frankliniella occidentalis]